MRSLTVCKADKGPAARRHAPGLSLGHQSPTLLIRELHPSACVRHGHSRAEHHRPYCRVRRHERLLVCFGLTHLDLPAELTGLPGEHLALLADHRGFLAASPVFLFVPEVQSAIPVFLLYYPAQDGHAGPQLYSPSWYCDVRC